MTTITVSGFGGTQPRTAPRLLPDNGARRAENVKLQSGELRPLNQPRIVYTPNKPMPPKTIYRARSGESAGWLSWPIDVDVVIAPLSADAQSRYYWTGDGEPKMAEHTEAISGGNEDYPHTAFALGVPKPQDKPTVSVTGGTGSTITRFYAVTFWSQKSEESALSPISASVDGKTDGTWTVSNLAAFPVNSGNLSGTHAGGVTTFSTSGYHWLRKGDPVLLDGTLAKVRSVLSPTSFTVLGNFSTAATWARQTGWNINGMKRRLYRTTGTAGSWQLVNDDVGTSYTDLLSDAAILGDELISEDWLPPPAELQGMFVHSSGALGGFFGNRLCFSEPMQPHAWPEKYRLATDYPIVGCAPFGSSVGVVTTGNPYVADGVEPASMSMPKFDGKYPGVSKRSVVSVGDGVLYASNHGLMYVSGSGVAEKPFTDPWYTRDEWVKLNPPSMECEFANGALYCSYRTGLNESAILVFDSGTHTTIGLAVAALYADQSTGQLYLGTDEGIAVFDPDEQSYPMVGSWRSKDFVIATPTNLGAAKLDFKLAIDPAALVQLNAGRAAQTAKNQALLNAGGFFGAMNFSAYNERGVNSSEAYYVPPLPPTNDVQFVLRIGERVIFQKVIKNSKAFRLPEGIKYDSVSVEVSGQGTLQRVILAETMQGLKLV